MRKPSDAIATYFAALLTAFGLPSGCTRAQAAPSSHPPSIASCERTQEEWPSRQSSLQREAKSLFSENQARFQAAPRKEGLSPYEPRFIEFGEHETGLSETLVATSTGEEFSLGGALSQGLGEELVVKKTMSTPRVILKAGMRLIVIGQRAEGCAISSFAPYSAMGSLGDPSLGGRFPARLLMAKRGDSLWTIRRDPKQAASKTVNTCVLDSGIRCAAMPTWSWLVAVVDGQSYQGTRSLQYREEIIEVNTQTIVPTW